MIIFILVLLILDKGDSAYRHYVDRSREKHQYGRESKSLIESYFRPQSPPQFLNRGNLLTVPKGSSVTLPCRVENLGENTVIWKKGSRQIFVGNIKVRKDLRSSIIDGTSLKIEAVDTMYAGNYTCEIEWSENEAPMEITHLLEVLVPPSVRAADRDKHDDDFPDIRLAREGDNITLSCVATGIPKPSITWMTKQENWVNVKANRLTIASVRRSDAGKYSCIASNGVGYPNSYNFSLSVQHSPIVTPGENPVISGPGAVKAELNCLVESEPSSTVNWYFNGSRISSPKDPRYRMEQNKHNFSLIIFNVKETDLGIYTCSADNRIGQGETDIVLSAIPFDLEILSPSDGRHRHFFNLTWSVKSYSQIFGAIIKKRKLPRDRSSPGISTYSHWERVEVTAPHIYGQEFGSSLDNWSGSHSGPHVWKETFQFTGLEPSSEYEVSVRVKNKYGAFETSQKFVFRTSRTDPSSQMIMRTSSSSNWFSSGSSFPIGFRLLLILSFFITCT